MSRTPVSPKVIVGVVVGILFTSLASNVTALTPDMFDFLGPWKLFVFGVLLTAIKAVAEYYKADPLRIPVDPPSADQSAPASNVVNSTPVASTTAVATGPGSAVQSEATPPAAPVYSNDPTAGGAK
jgi:hypothetical protein